MRIATLTLALSFFVAGLFVASSQGQFIPEKNFTLPAGQFLGAFVAKGDFNHDNKLDVLFSATTSGGKPELVVLPGTGGGGFGAPIITMLTGGDNLSLGTVGDVNGDGIPDAVIVGTDPITAVPEIGVMLADGTGKFAAPVFFHSPFASTFPGTMVLGDFNGGGKTDLAILGSPVTVFPGNGNGTFGSPVSSGFNYGANCSAVADFNKDGKLDIATGTDVLLGNGNGTFKSPLPVTNGTCDVAVGDFNKDGIPDIVTADSKSKSRSVRVFIGDKTGRFKTSTLYATGSAPGHGRGLGFAIDNFTNDTKVDIAVSNSNDSDVTMLLGKGDGTFTIGGTFAVSDGGLLSGDFNGDHKTDLVVGTRLGTSLLLGRGNGTFVAQTALNGQLGGEIRLADFNGDTKPDLIEFEAAGHPGGVRLGNGHGSFGSLIPLPSNCQSNAGVVSQFNHDNAPDIAFVEGTGGGVGVCLGKGDGTFNDAVVYDAGVQHGFVLAGDFNHDGKIDLLASDAGGFSVLLGNGDGTFKTALLTALSGFSVFTTADFNHDGKLDIAAVLNSGVIGVLLGKGDGTFQPVVTSPNLNGSGPIAAGDLDHDGNPDLVTNNYSIPNGVGILMGNGDGTFKAPTVRPLSLGGNILIRDVDGDGKLDLLVGSADLLHVLLGNGNGTFQATKNFTTGLGGVSMAAADINGDGLLDVAYQLHTGTLIVFLNQGH